jgi:hypothetical protein
VSHFINRRVVARAAGVTAVLAAAATFSVGTAGAATVNGTATIANPANGNPLPSGASTKPFTVTLPSGASCSGDTANGGYHVYSYLVHAGTDITTVTFVNFPSQGYGFVDNTGTYYGPANTAINTGQIIGIPNNFQWAPLVTTAGGSLPVSEILYSGSSGLWEAGLVCANSTGHVVDYWNTEVTFTSSNSDANGFTWAAVPGPPAQAPEVPLTLILPLVAAGVIGGGIGLKKYRGRAVTEAVSTA